MNIKNIAAAVSSLVLLSVAGAALAEQPYPDDVKFVSTKTRAEVIAELQQARANGEIITGNAYPGAGAPFRSTLTRAQVIAQLAQARARGEIALNNYNGAALLPVAAHTSGKTRAEVMQELKDYQQAHAATGAADMNYQR
jgi:predicted RNase H-like HicB family nuclease